MTIFLLSISGYNSSLIISYKIFVLEQLIFSIQSYLFLEIDCLLIIKIRAFKLTILLSLEINIDINKITIKENLIY